MEQDKDINSQPVEIDKALLDKMYEKANVKENTNVAIKALTQVVFHLYGEQGMKYINEKLLKDRIIFPASEKPQPHHE